MALLDCPCGRKIVTKPEWAGKRIKCSACGAVLAVPEDDTSEGPAGAVCPSCGKEVRDGAYRCPSCKEALKRPASLSPAAPLDTATGPAPAEPASGTTKPCPFCAEPIQADAIKCRFCGEMLNRPVPPIRARSRPQETTDTGGTGAFVMGLLGWIICGFLHPIAWYMGASYEAECRARGVKPSGLGQAGRIMGLIGTILLGVALAFIVVIMIVGAVSR